MVYGNRLNLIRFFWKAVLLHYAGNSFAGIGTIDRVRLNNKCVEVETFGDFLFFKRGQISGHDAMEDNH